MRMTLSDKGLPSLDEDLKPHQGPVTINLELLRTNWNEIHDWIKKQ